MPTKAVTYRATLDTSGVGRGVAAAGRQISGLHSAMNRLSSAGSGFGRAFSAAGLNFGPATQAAAALGAGVQHVTDRLDDLEKHGSRIQKVGAAMTGVGIATAGIGAGLTLLADPLTQAEAQLDNALKNTGSSLAAYKGQVAAAANSASYLGSSWTSTEGLLARLVVASGSGKAALTLFNAAQNVTAATGMDLDTVVRSLSMTMGGRAPRAFAQLGISTADINTALGKAGTTFHAHEAATNALAKAQENLANVETRMGAAGASAAAHDQAAQTRRAQAIMRAITAEQAALGRLDALKSKTGVTTSNLAGHEARLAAAQDRVTRAQDRVAAAELRVEQGGKHAASAQLSLQSAQESLTAAESRLTDVQNQGVTTRTRGAASAYSLEAAQQRVAAAEGRVQQLEGAGINLSKLSVSQRLALQKAEQAVAAAQAKVAASSGGTAAAARHLTQEQVAQNISALVLAKTHGALAARSATLGAHLAHLRVEALHDAQVWGQKYGPAVTAAGVAVAATGTLLDGTRAVIGMFTHGTEAATTATETLRGAQAAGSVEAALSAATTDAVAASMGVEAVAAEGAAAGTSMFGAALDIALGPIGLALAAAAALGVGIYELVEHWHAVTHAFEVGWGVVERLFEAGWHFVKRDADYIGVALMALGGPIGLMVGAGLLLWRNWDAVVHGIETVVGHMVGFVVDAFRTQVDVVLWSVETMLQAASHLPFVGHYFKSAEDAVRGFGRDFDATMNGVAQSAYGWGSATGQNVGRGMAAGMSKSEAESSAAAHHMGTAAMTAIAHSTGTHSPSTVADYFGRMAAAGYAQGFAGETGRVAATVGAAAVAMLSGVSGGATRARSAAAAHGGVAGRPPRAGGGGSAGMNVTLRVDVTGALITDRASAQQLARLIAPQIVQALRQQFRGSGDLGIAFAPRTFTTV